MIIDSRGVPRDTTLEADVCVVGSGAAGIPLALKLAEQGLSVLLLEGGFAHEDPRTQALYGGEVVDERLHSPPDKYRKRVLGGATLIWGGRCVPFDPIDFEYREHMPLSGWPIGYDDIAPFFPSANAWSEAGQCLYEADQVFDAATTAMIAGFSSPIVRTDSLERFSYPTNFAARYSRRMRIAPRLTVVTGANCTAIRLESNGSQVRSLDVATLDGNRFSARARMYALAVGGIETPRLLLASRDVVAAGIGNEHDVVGRYYMCHIAGNVGTLTVNGPINLVRNGYEVAPDGVYCRRRLSLIAAEQRRLRLSNMVARLHFPRIADPAHHNGVLSGLFLARYLISYEYAKRLNDGDRATLGTYLRHLRNIVSDPFDTSAFLLHWLNKRVLAARKFPSVILRNRTNRFSLEVHGEQSPQANSRVTLSDARDELGVPMVRVDWRYTPADVESVQRTLDVIAAELQRTGAGRFEYRRESFEEDLLRFGAYGGHHIGTARMGSDVRTSVVNADCRLHSVDNLYVAGSAAFATSGQANPTLTLIALSLRLAQHLTRRLGAGVRG